MITLQPGGAYTPNMRFHFDYGVRQSVDIPLTMTREPGAVFGTAVFGADKFGQSEVTRDEKVTGRGSGRTIGLSVEHSAGGEPFRVAQISYQADVNGEDTGDVAA